MSLSPPPALLAGYTMSGQVPMEHFYVDETAGGQGTHYRYPSADIAAMLVAAERQLRRPHARPTQRWLTEAIAREAKGASAVVYGSIEPWVEVLLLAAGAANVTTVEYNRLTHEHPQLLTTTVLAHKEEIAGGRTYDLAVAHGAFDHDGLGRYRTSYSVRTSVINADHSIHVPCWCKS